MRFLFSCFSGSSDASGEQAEASRRKSKVSSSRSSSWYRFDMENIDVSRHIGVQGSCDEALGTDAIANKKSRISPPSKEIPQVLQSSKEDVSINKDRSIRSSAGSIAALQAPLPAPWAPVQIVKISTPAIIRAGGPISSGTMSPMLKQKSFNGSSTDYLQEASPCTAKSGPLAQPQSSGPRPMSLLSRQIKEMSSLYTSEQMMGSCSTQKKSRRESGYSNCSTPMTLSGPLEPIMFMVDAAPFKCSPQESNLLKMIREDVPLSADCSIGEPWEQARTRSSFTDDADSLATIQTLRNAAADALREIASQYAEKAIASGRPYYSSGNKPVSPFSRPIN